MLDFPVGSVSRWAAHAARFLVLFAALFSSHTFANPIPNDGGWAMFANEQSHPGQVSQACADHASSTNSIIYVETTPFGDQICWRRNFDPCDPPESWDNQTYQCTSDGQSPGQCTENDPDGAVWDTTSESCQCPEGSTDVFLPDASYKCLSVPPECTASSPGFRGYADDTPVCDMNEFCPSGHSGGMGPNGWACYPDSTCSDGETYINGSCIGPDNISPDPNTDFNETDTDGDGIPDSNDDDIDGDGTPNGQDDDIDGDGIPNADDPTEEGDKDKEGSANASGGCTVAPQCTGDPQECAILKQQWYTMCHSDFESPDEQEFTSAAQDRYDQAQADWDETMQTIYSEVSNKLDFNLSSGSGSLPNDVRSVFGQNINFSISQFGSQLGNVGNLIYFACTLLAAGILLRR